MNSDLGSLLEAVKGKKIVGKASDSFKGVSIDSRTLRPQQLFFCIRGDRFDGHNFLKEVIKKKAGGIVISNRDIVAELDLEASGTFVVWVPDTLKAMQDLAKYRRNQLNLKVIGVTGSNGKSTTKEMIAAVVSAVAKTFKTRGNLNNHIGLPLNIFELEESHEVAVFEMGMSAAGEIRQLAEIARPEVGLITNISKAHMVHLKTIHEVQAAKGELFEALPESGTAIVNADDPLVRDLAVRLRSKTITFGIEKPADVQARDIKLNGTSGYDFTAKIFDHEIAIHVPLLGFGNVYNALAAITTGYCLGVPLETMNESLNKIEKLSQRCEVIQFKSMFFINDAYNANPQSMRQALDTLINFQHPGKKILVLGDMLELGEAEHEEHKKIGEIIAGLKIDHLVTVGGLAEEISEGAFGKGMPNDHIHRFKKQNEAADFLKNIIQSGDCILFKGSRGAEIEIVFNDLMEKL